MKIMVSKNELNNYRINVIESFLEDILEVKDAKHDAISLCENISEEALVKLVHFFDMISQTTNGKSPACSHCNGNCRKCSDNEAESKE